ncbi:MAG: hypothetical protein WCO84_07040 [bacterium]
MEEGYACLLVSKLQKQGDWVILWTGTPSTDIQRESPGLAEMVDRFMRKDCLGYEILEDMAERGMDNVTEVAILDDDEEAGRSMMLSFNFSKPGIARWFHAKNWKYLLKDGGK